MAAPSTDPAKNQSTDTAAAMSQPIIVDLGKQKASRLQELEDGEGELWDEVLDVLDEVKEMLGQGADGKVLVPVVMIYEKKQRPRRLEQMLFPLANWDEVDADDEDEEDED